MSNIEIDGFAIIDDPVKVNEREWSLKTTVYPPTYHAVPPIASRERYYIDPVYHGICHGMARFISGTMSGKNRVKYTVHELYQAVRIAEELANEQKETNADEHESTAETA